MDDLNRDPLESSVIVPLMLGPLVRVKDLDRSRDDIDELLDDVFGPPDDRRPGVVDAILLVAGLAVVVVAQAASLAPIVTVGGLVAAALGAVLPLRSLWRRVGSLRRSRRVRSMLGDGVLLRTDHPCVEHLLGSHARLLEASAVLAGSPRQRVEAVAHSAVLEVATLLDGGAPRAAAEMDYVDARSRALEDLAAVVMDPRVGDGEPDRRRAMVEARREVEEISGDSSLRGAAAVSRQLLDGNDA